MARSGAQALDEVLRESTAPAQRKKIWIDLDNTPHIPFFLPIIDRLQQQGYRILLTARDSYQVCEMLRFHNLSCKVVGGHWGKHRFFKAMAIGWRAIRLVLLMATQKPDLAVAHGSRAQALCCAMLGVPSVSIIDYEFAASSRFLRPKWTFMPELIPNSRLNRREGVMKYPGLKEDVYAPQFMPDPSLKNALGLCAEQDGKGIGGSELLVTVRPPATEAHYHNPESEILLEAALNLLMSRPDVRVVLLPRNKRQENELRSEWEEWIAKGKIVIPEAVVDGLNLIWFSDLVISGGGTMNREAAALGVPVYSIFRGKIGAVDRYLAETGRLVLLETVGDVRRKLHLKRREKGNRHIQEQSAALRTIVKGIVSIAEHGRLPGSRM